MAGEVYMKCFIDNFFAKCFSGSGLSIAVRSISEDYHTKGNILFPFIEEDDQEEGAYAVNNRRNEDKNLNDDDTRKSLIGNIHYSAKSTFNEKCYKSTLI